MTRLVEFDLEDGTKVYMEVDEKLPVPKSSSAVDEDVEGLIGLGDEIAVKASQTLENALSTVKPVANAIFNKIQSLNKPADEVEVKFGVKMSAEVGAVIASGNGEVNYEITLKWDNREKSSN